LLLRKLGAIKRSAKEFQATLDGTRVSLLGQRSFLLVLEERGPGLFHLKKLNTYYFQKYVEG